MLRRRLYYFMKPYTPWGVRMIFRRLIARRQWRRNRATWPIDAAAAAAPSNWPGWPNGKKFAVVLTHDVEGPVGLDRCRALAEQELALGFHSSFNFIPEGSYQVSSGLRQWLTGNGFEVGVHDLQHDGFLYVSADGFRQRAIRINGYLERWGAVGFRSGFMLRNLEWLQQLNISYDASTFDTDPFEWQSDGARTLFPFVVSPERAAGSTEEDDDGSDDRSYVELPYTLPQDSTLFLLLQQKSPEIWCNKLDWIAQHGGMALLNVHPDYLHFKTSPGRPAVSDHYAQFLRYALEKYGNTFWQPLPREVAAFVRTWQPQPLKTVDSR